MRMSNIAAYSLHNGSSFPTLSFKILFHISDGVVDSDIVLRNGVEIMNVTDGAWSVINHL